MWRELLDVLKSGKPLQAMADEFIQMLDTTQEMSTQLRPHVFSYDLPLNTRSRIYKLDIKVNKLERSVRKRIITHLTLGRGELNYCLLLMSLVKDAERVGDYLKNISEVAELGGSELPPGLLREELEKIIALATEMLDETATIIKGQNRDRALELLGEGRHAGKRCDRLLVELAKSDLTPAQTTSMVLLTRFHKRLGGHLMNILSSVVMPLHKVDFLDLKELEGLEATKGFGDTGDGGVPPDGQRPA